MLLRISGVFFVRSNFNIGAVVAIHESGETGWFDD